VRVVLCRPADLGPAEISRWRQLQREDPRQANPFLAPEFAIVLARHRPDTWVAVLEDGSGIVGFFPFHRGRFGIGRALGYGVSNLQGVVHTSGLEWDSADLLARCGLAVFEFDEFLPYQCQRLAPRHVESEPAPFTDLSVGFDVWLKTKLATTRALKAIQRKQRKLEREVGELSFTFDSRHGDTLDLLMHWKSLQYRRTGRFDRFARPWFRSAFTDLAEVSTPDFAAVRSVLSVDGRPVAIEQSLYANGILSDWFPAYDVDVAAYSPGQVCFLETFRAASRHGVHEVDFGKGYAQHKEIFKDGDHAVAGGWAERRSPVATLRRLQQTPRRRTLEFVLARPKLRRTARRVLDNVGQVRTTWGQG
jgi:CelD/BcsL family acetyltransferase involved in cellulose biosynthesis